MARKALFIGPRLKRVRRDLGLTQANMAADLEISPSYVALMERNQRPITADLLLRLASTYKIDIASLADDDSEDLAKRLQATLKQPIFADIDLPALDSADIATSYPGFAEALLRLHTAFTEEQMAHAQRREMASTGDPSVTHDPVGEARAFLAARRNCFPALDDHANEVAQELAADRPREESVWTDALVNRLVRKHGQKVRFTDPELILGSLRWHDRHREQVLISNRLDHPGRRFQLAFQIGLLESREVITSQLVDGRFSGENARRLASRALTGYWAAALLMPYRPFLRAARHARHDLETLSRRFAASFEQVAHRLTTLGRPGEEGVPFFFLRIDRAGNVSKRLDGAGFPFARTGGSCPLWHVHSAFEAPGHILPQWLELPEGERFLSIARTVEAGGGSWDSPRATRSVALACAAEHAGHVIYGDDLAQEKATPIGVACRLCHRPHCIARSAPPIGREMRPDDNRDTGVPFAFASD
ncbi:helix-turn-helix domain-containing protein [Croceicoccus bisphenolivorans]|uniref:helix-turn-helix domain-containing protein n=1 Tax=Croceicoccus bisphenolivorans TaxID=1783232 RepID=UPI0008298D9B|nr:helix-turn-helix transcriptional regulator [Croceicoccus bisphenolivorans]